jgi:peptide/nickel transport system permease protein
MLLTITKRVLTFAFTMLLATFVVFILMQLVPGDPATAIAGMEATPERLAEIRADLGLDRPVVVQYVDWLGNAVQGDLGTSLWTGQPVTEIIKERLPATLQVVGFAIVLAVIIGVPVGVLAAVRPGSARDRALTGVSTLGVAVPNFWLGMVLIYLFAIKLGWLPSSGFRGISSGFGEFVRYSILPAFAMATVGAAEIIRQLRGSLLDVMSSDYIRTARSKGLPKRTIIVRHGLRNASVTLLTVIGLLANRLVGATVVVEAVFAIPGAGSMVVEAVRQRDYPLIQGMVLVLAIIVLLNNALVDVLYRRIDPRIRS